MLRADADLGAALGRQAAADAAAMFSAEAYHVIVRDATVCPSSGRQEQGAN